jgi:hypothetical protein
MAENKSLKISFAVDQLSFQQVQLALQKLTDQAQAFANALNGGRGGGGGMSPGGILLPGGSGGMVGVGVSSAPGVTTSQAAVRAGGSRGGAFGGMSDSLKALAKDSKASFQIVEDTFKRAIDSQEKNLGRYQRVLNNLNKEYADLKNTGNASAAELAKIGNKALEAANKMDKLEESIRSTKDAMKNWGSVNADPSDLGGGGGGGGGGPGFMGRMGRRLMPSSGGMGKIPFAGAFRALAGPVAGLGAVAAWGANEFLAGGTGIFGTGGFGKYCVKIRTRITNISYTIGIFIVDVANIDVTKRRETQFRNCDCSGGTTD